MVSAAAGAGLVLGFRVATAGEPAAGDAAFEPNAFLRIGTDDTVTVLSKHIEFGQGIYTGLATLIAEELDADWSSIRVEAAPADASLYNNLLWGPTQGTGGSTGIANSYLQMRRAGAAARAMLVAAAAREWGVPAGTVVVEEGVVSHPPTGRSARFGDLAAAAATIEPPAEVVLKEPEAFKLIGRRLPRVDTAAKITGAAVFTSDVRLPGMLTAVLARPPLFGARAKSVDATRTRAIPGVVDVVETPRGVAVLAEHFWAAQRGRDVLEIGWDLSDAETRGSDQILASYWQALARPGAVARADGDAERAMGAAARVLEAAFEFPFLAHVPLEPLDCVVRLGADDCEIWAGSQVPTVDQRTAARILGLPPAKVAIHTLLAGGSFGRRATPDADVVSEAVTVAKAIGGRAPVKVIWTREDDIRGGRYRPMYLHWLRAGLDAAGEPTAWQHRIVGQSILQRTPFEGAIGKSGIDPTSVEGASNLPYAIPNLTVDLVTTAVGVPVLWWRAVGSTHTAYATEVFIDELALAAGRDPVDFRLALLKNHPRHRAVLARAAREAGWGSPLPAGKGRGIAVHESFDTFVAQVAEVAVDAEGRLKVERVVCAVDCGVAVNPDIIRAQMEGGIGFGLGAVLHNAITLKEGRVEQSNFDDYPPLRIHEMPAVDVHIVASTESPTGVGEPGVPPIGPAVANAVFAATGRRIRTLPFARHGLRTA
jgi:isoquinoline 1-oxidoreductase beta subunit